MTIHHDESAPEVDTTAESEPESQPVPAADSAASSADAVPPVDMTPPTESLPQPDLEQIDLAQSTLPPEEVKPLSNPIENGSVEPSLGGTLNATTDQAAEDARR